VTAGSSSRRYEDDRIDAAFPVNMVAQPGQRLRRRFPTALIVALVVVIVLPMLFGVLLFAATAISVAIGG
jgi:hypothetical protein